MSILEPKPGGAPQRSWRDGLSGATRRIAETDANPLRVLAGPGTGKTFSLMRRVARVLDDGLQPSSVLVVTFTRTSAQDLRRSLDGLGVPGIESVDARTLHSWCAALLAEEHVLKSTGRVPRALMDFEARFLQQDLKLLGLGDVDTCTEKIEAFQGAWARLQSDEPGWPPDSDKPFHEALQAWLLFHRAMLLGELVTESLRFLRGNPETPALKRYQHVLVDEYQDLNKAEQMLVDTIASRSSLTVVGDENQSIYWFKNAHPDGIREFAESHPNTVDEHLLECRRCPPIVVNLANALIAQNKSATQQPLQAKSDAQGEVYVVQWNSPIDETQGIAKYIDHQIQLGNFALEDVLILSARREPASAIAGVLNGLSRPSEVLFNETVLRGTPVKPHSAQQAITLLNLLVDCEDRVALRCWIGFGHKELRADEWSTIRDASFRSGQSPWQLLQDTDRTGFGAPIAAAVRRRFATLQSELARFNELTGEALLDALFPQDESWGIVFRKLAADLPIAETTPNRLRDHLRAALGQRELPLDVNYIRAMSLHKSKGLTARLVVVIHCIEGVLPSLDSKLTPQQREEAIEQQRRLFYVAVTRSAHTLVLSSVVKIEDQRAHREKAGFTRRRGRFFAAQTSRYVNELGPTRPRVLRGDQFLSLTSTDS